MDTKAFEYAGRVRGKLSPLTNRSEMVVSRIVRVLTEQVPGLSEASLTDIHHDPTMNATAKAIWRFTNLSRIVEIEGLAYALPGIFASASEILAAWECFLADDPGFWEYLGDEIQTIDTPDAPPEALPDAMYSKEELADPNSDAAGSTTTLPDAKKSRATSGGARKRGAARSGTATTGTPS